MSLFVLVKQFLGTLVLLLYHVVDLGVDGLGCLFAVRTCERVLLVVVVTEV